MTLKRTVQGLSSNESVRQSAPYKSSAPPAITYVAELNEINCVASSNTFLLLCLIMINYMIYYDV